MVHRERLSHTAQVDALAQSGLPASGPWLDASTHAWWSRVSSSSIPDCLVGVVPATGHSCRTPAQINCPLACLCCDHPVVLMGLVIWHSPSAVVP
jgi:hypothetical protein